jgi:hypothetical protein
MVWKPATAVAESDKMVRILLLVTFLFLAGCSSQGNVDFAESTPTLTATAVSIATVAPEVTKTIVVVPSATPKTPTATPEPTSTPTPEPSPTAEIAQDYRVLMEPKEITASWGSFNFSIEVSGTTAVGMINDIQSLDNGVTVRQGHENTIRLFLETAFYYTYVQQTGNAPSFADFQTNPANYPIDTVVRGSDGSLAIHTDTITLADIQHLALQITDV